MYNTRRYEPRYNFTRALQLDIFRKINGRWRRINRIPLRYVTGFGSTNLTVQSEFLWLDAPRTIPVLKLRIFSLSNGEGPVGDEVGVVFPTGWQHKAMMQSWAWGSWFSSNSVGQTNDWSQRDKKGFLQVVSTVTTDVYNPEERSYWQWRGGHFQLTQREADHITPDGTKEIKRLEIKD